mmetsp:Transcript_46289/g.144993  ORF Transcript_46289/g.144993 Transcript_46289/m.144993 type:complete len:377 (+) Transcript_46289:1604-2734(+)
MGVSSAAATSSNTSSRPHRWRRTSSSRMCLRGMSRWSTNSCLARILFVSEMRESCHSNSAATSAMACASLIETRRALRQTWTHCRRQRSNCALARLRGSCLQQAANSIHTKASEPALALATTGKRRAACSVRRDAGAPSSQRSPAAMPVSLRNSSQERPMKVPPARWQEGRSSGCMATRPKEPGSPPSSPPSAPETPELSRLSCCRKRPAGTSRLWRPLSPQQMLPAPTSQPSIVQLSTMARGPTRHFASTLLRMRAVGSVLPPLFWQCSTPCLPPPGLPPSPSSMATSSAYSFDVCTDRHCEGSPDSSVTTRRSTCPWSSSANFLRSTPSTAARPAAAAPRPSELGASREGCDTRLATRSRKNAKPLGCAPLSMP